MALPVTAVLTAGWLRGSRGAGRMWKAMTSLVGCVAAEIRPVLLLKALDRPAHRLDGVIFMYLYSVLTIALCYKCLSARTLQYYFCNHSKHL